MPGMSKPCGVEINLLCGTTIDDLWNKFIELAQIRRSVLAMAQDKAKQWENATDPTFVEMLWSEREELYRHYRIVSAWTELMYSMHTFAELGPRSEFLDDQMVIDEIGRR